MAESSAPILSLLRILGLCWRERATLPAELIERLREQLEGPLDPLAKADAAVLDACRELDFDWLRNIADCPGSPVRLLAQRELARRRLRSSRAP